MIAEILCVGTELLLGDIVNTNAAFLARELAAMGIDVYHQEVVGDNPARLSESLSLAFSRSDLVVMTGGLGPTYDDLTKETVAQYFKLPMAVHEESLAKMREYFSHRGIPMSENNEKQAMMPRTATVFANGNGTAPGLAVEKEGKIAVLMPGPPSEMQPMFLQEVAPYLARFSGHTILSRTIHLIGIGESALEQKLRPMMTGYQNPTIAPYAKTGEVQLRVTACAKTRAEAGRMIAPVIEEIKGQVGEYIYGIDVGNLQNAAVALLIEKGLKVATAESCTGGYISKRITDVPGSSAVFDCGICSYSNEMKREVLGVRDETLSQFGAVSEQTALEMAEGVRKLSGSDIGVSTTGIAGPDGGSEQKPVGLVYLAVCSKWYTRVEKLLAGSKKQDGREYVRYLASSRALKLVIDAAREAEKKS